MPALKKYKGFKIKRLSGDTETIVNVLQGGYKTDAGGKMVSWRKVSLKGNKLIEHEDRVNPDGTPYESSRGRKPATKATAKKDKTKNTKPKEKVKKNIAKASDKKKDRAEKESKKKVKRIPVDEVGTVKVKKDKESKPTKEKKKKRIKKEEFIRFTKEYVEGELYQSLVTAINQALADQPYNLKVRKETKCEYNNVKETGGPEALYFVQIVPEENNRPHVRPKPQPSNLPEPKKKKYKEHKLKLKTLTPETFIVGVNTETLEQYAKTYERAVRFFAKKKGKVIAKTLAEFGVGKLFVDTKTNEISMMVGYNKEWKRFMHVIVMSMDRRAGDMDSLKLSYLLKYCEPAESNIQEVYNDMYVLKHGEEETDLKPASDTPTKEGGKIKKKKKKNKSVKSELKPKIKDAKSKKERDFGQDFDD
jgi:hypothetical protein